MSKQIFKQKSWIFQAHPFQHFYKYFYEAVRGTYN